ncbi:MAG: hypothetical protein ACFFCW_46630, partial [Candidatus Hodarchaeota archaeon]
LWALAVVPRLLFLSILVDFGIYILISLLGTLQHVVLYLVCNICLDQLLFGIFLKHFPYLQ